MILAGCRLPSPTNRSDNQLPREPEFGYCGAYIKIIERISKRCETKLFHRERTRLMVILNTNVH